MKNLKENTKPTGKKVWDKPRKIVIVTTFLWRSSAASIHFEPVGTD